MTLNSKNLRKNCISSIKNSSFFTQSSNYIKLNYASDKRIYQDFFDIKPAAKEAISQYYCASGAVNMFFELKRVFLFCFVVISFQIHGAISNISWQIKPPLCDLNTVKNTRIVLF